MIKHTNKKQPTDRSNKSISFFSSNIRSLRYKTDLLLAELDKCPDIIAIQETHLDDTITSDSVSLPGYSIVRKDRSIHGGGVTIYVSDRLGWERINPKLSAENSVEFVCIDIIIGTTRSRICNVYRPESPIEWYCHFEELLEQIGDTSDDTYIMGDFNIDFTPVTGNSQRLQNILAQHNMTQHVTEPTRITEDSQTTIDLFITRNTNEADLTLLKTEPPYASDHNTVIAQVSQPQRSVPVKKQKWLYDQGDYEGLNGAIHNEDWCFLKDPTLDINTVSMMFMDKLADYIKEYIPNKYYVTRPQDKPWMNNAIRRQMRRRQRLFTKASQSTQGRTEKWATYQKQRNQVNKMIRQAKNKHSQRKFDLINQNSRNKDRNWWKIIRHCMRTKSSSIPALRTKKADGTEQFHNSDREKADVLNKHFVDTTDVKDANHVFPATYPTTSARLDAFQLQESDTMKAIDEIDVDKAPGPDSISPIILKKTKDTICGPLTILFNRSLADGIFPTVWKISHVIPIYKKGDKTDPQNYRPISLTSVVSKVFEKAVVKYILNFLTTNNLIYIYTSQASSKTIAHHTNSSKSTTTY